MKKITRLILFVAAIIASSSMMNAQVSEFCSTPSGHLSDPNFGDAHSHILLTITNVDANTITVKVEPNTGGSAIDYLLVLPTGFPSVAVGTNEGTVLSEYKATLTFATPPANIELQVLWSNPAWPGQWMTNKFTVPFAAKCNGGGSTDTTKPVMVSASVVGTPTFSSANLLLSATDDVTTPVTSFVANDAANGVVNKALTADATGNATISGLNAATTYNLTITAKDAALNVSDNSKVVTFTTAVAPVLSTIDFETVGQDWSWQSFSNGDGDPIITPMVTNPSSTGVNTSAHCAKFVVNASASPWAGLWSEKTAPITFNSTNCKVKLMAYKSVISNFDVKFEGAAGLNFEKLVPNTLINQWEELTFDFSSQIGKTVTRLVIIPDFPAARTAGSTNYFDNISFNSINTGINEIESNNVRLYPNPVHNELNISSDLEISQIEIRNLVGQTVKLSTTNTVDLSKIPTGNYFVSVKLANGQISNQKFIKQ